MGQSQHFRRTSNQTLIQNWLSDRQTVIVTLHNLCDLRPFSQDHNVDINEQLQEFCTLLVDYISRGHFEIYEHISDAIDKSGYTPARLSRKLLECLMETTIFTLDFNDKYLQKNELTSLDKDLSKLALVFAQRLEWEDQLIAQYQLAKQNTLRIAKTA